MKPTAMQLAASIGIVLQVFRARERHRSEREPTGRGTALESPDETTTKLRASSCRAIAVSHWGA